MEFKSKELRGPILQPFRRFVLGELKRDKEFLRKVDRGNALHDFRVSTRRVHTWLQAIGPSLGEEASKPIQKSLKKLLSNTTDLRDVQVHKKLLKRWRDSAKGEERNSLELVYVALSKSGEKADKKLANKLRKIFSKMAKKARRFVKKDAAQKADVGLSAVLSKRLGEDSLEFVKLHKSAGRNPSPENLHLLRISGKKLRYLIEPFMDHNSSVPSLVTELKELQDDLGYVHDLDVLAVRIRNLMNEEKRAAEFEPALKRCEGLRERKVKKVSREWFGEHGDSLVEDVDALSNWFEKL